MGHTAVRVAESAKLRFPSSNLGVASLFADAGSLRGSTSASQAEWAGSIPVTCLVF